MVGGSGRTTKPPTNHQPPTNLRLLLLVLLLGAPLSAHHGSSAYHVDREITITGIVKEWRWSDPHTWVYLTVKGSGGTEVWDGEGPPLTWAAQRGWSSATLKNGEGVSLVMYPSKREARAGLVKRIRRANGETLDVSRPWLDR
jgi:hypothetical protein